jgi:integrase
MRQPTSRVLFSKKVVEKQPVPKSGRVQIYDEKVRDLGLRIESSGRKSFFWRRKVQGRPTFKAIGVFPSTTVEQARGKAHEHSGNLDKLKRNDFEGPNPFERPHLGAKVTFGEAAEDYVKRYIALHSAKPEKAAKYYRWLVGKYFSDWKDRRLNAITRKHVSDLYKELGSRNGKTTANRALQFCRALFNYAAGDADLWSGRNPAQLSKKERYTENEVCRCLSPEELVRFTDTLEKETDIDFKHFVTLALATAQRKGNILAARWAAIDLDAQTWTILKTEAKNKKSNVVDLTPAALRVLRERLATRKEKNEWVFPSLLSASGHVEEFKRQWLDFVKRAGLDYAKDSPLHFRLHDIRHTAVSYKIMAGKSLEQVGAAVGHLSVLSTKRYSHIQKAVRREAMLAGEKEIAARIAAARKKSAETAMVQASKEKVKSLEAPRG